MTALTGRRIAITRAAEDAGSLAGRLAALGADPLVVPAITIVAAPPAPLDAALTRLHRFHWITFTSRHAVRAVFGRGITLEGPRIAAVGRATADALAEQATGPDLVPAVPTAEALLEALGDVRGQRILFPASAVARRVLPEGLRARGAHVLEVVAYDTRPVPTVYPALATADAVTFTSPSTVTGLLTANRVPAAARVVCLGPTTADAARAAGLRVDAVAEEHTEEGLVHALRRALRDPGKETAS